MKPYFVRARHRTQRRTRRRAQHGFTLIEMLAVILILAILAAVLLTNLGDATAAVKVSTTKNRLTELGSAAESYKNDNGHYPPSSFEPGQDVGNDGLNVGIEAFCVAMWSKQNPAGEQLKDLRDKVINSDGDSSPKQLTDFGNRDLFEIPDEWDNPIAYIEKSDYAAQNRRYKTSEAQGDADAESAPIAFKNLKTGLYYNATSYQFISAGPDGRFGTEDDITSFPHDQ